jgi:hypothetical protein
MFFVAKEKIGTTLGAQKEYTACTRRGIGFVSHASNVANRGVWHYFWPSELIEPSIRARFETNRAPEQQPDAEDAEFGAERHNGPTHYLWSQEVGQGEVIGEPVINPYSGDGDWMVEAKAKFEARGGQ